MPKHAWQILEDDVEKHFLGRLAREQLVYHRFYDTRSAGNTLPEQPGDHLVIYKGVPILLESKQSVRPSLRSCFASNVPSSQLTHHHLWKRAGASCFFIFRHGNKGDSDIMHELWPSDHLFDCRRVGMPLEYGKRIIVTPSLDEALLKATQEAAERRDLLMRLNKELLDTTL